MAWMAAWMAILGSAIAIFLIGAYLFQYTQIKIARWYMVATALLFVVYFMNVALIFGPQYLPWPKYLLLAMSPGTLILAVWAIKRDRDEVLGKPEEREAAVAAAIVYGAGSYAEPGDLGGGMDSQ